MPVVTVRMDEELARRLEEQAKLQGISRSALIKQILKKTLDRASTSSVQKAILALRRGKRPGRKTDWIRIEKELQDTEPKFPTAEEAIAYSRRRPAAMQ